MFYTGINDSPEILMTVNLSAVIHLSCVQLTSMTVQIIPEFTPMHIFGPENISLYEISICNSVLKKIMIKSKNLRGVPLTNSLSDKTK